MFGSGYFAAKGRVRHAFRPNAFPGRNVLRPYTLRPEALRPYGAGRRYRNNPRTRPSDVGATAMPVIVIRM
jgi:hypothetical protein